MTNPLKIVAILDKKFALSQEDAEKIFPTLEHAIISQESVDLSFNEIENCSTIFLNSLLGKLYLLFGDKVDEYVHFIDIPNDDLVLPNQLERLRRRALNSDIYKPIFDSAIAEA